MDCFASLAMTGNSCSITTVPSGCGSKNFFIIFVDQMFTTSFERAFTNVFDAIDQNAAIACLCRACNAD